MTRRVRESPGEQTRLLAGAVLVAVPVFAAPHEVGTLMVPNTAMSPGALAELRVM